KFVGRSGNKGVIAKIIPEEKSWRMEDGTPIHFVVAAMGIIGRLNYAQLYEHSCNELGATVVRMMKRTDDLDEKLSYVKKLLKYLNPDEAKDFKAWTKDLSEKEKAKFCRRIERHGVTIFQEPIDNADILDFEKAYDHFEANYQRIVFPDGGKSMRKVLCAKMFYFRLKQDPLEKFSTRSHGPVNPLTTLPSKSNLKKKSMIPFSDVPVRFGEMELEILLAMVPHPYAIADFMTENSTSYEAKYALSEHNYVNGLYDPEECMITIADEDGDDWDDDDLGIEDYSETNLRLNLNGKKNVEQIEGLLNVLGTGIDIDYEIAPEGEFFRT
ncbi:MAG: hypothetical protein K2F99_09350, partial [Muribaculaceae bacterium]|nr:hypothetical protein [Muribaculaceae bacterium]